MVSKVTVYKYEGAEVAPQSDDFMFVPEYSGMYVMRFSTDYVRAGKYARLTPAFKWDEAGAGASERTEHREVTKYRQVPVQVQKQRTVTKRERASIWNLLFR